jgi:hypothetical protein
VGLSTTTIRIVMIRPARRLGYAAAALSEGGPLSRWQGIHCVRSAFCGSALARIGPPLAATLLSQVNECTTRHACAHIRVAIARR